MTDNPYRSPETLADTSESTAAGRGDKSQPTPPWVLFAGMAVGFTIWMTSRFLLYDWINAQTGSTYIALRLLSWAIGWGLLVLGRRIAEQLYQSTFVD